MKKKGKKEATEAEKATSEDGVPEKKSFLKKIFTLKFMIIFFLVLMILGGSIFAGWFFFLKKNGTESSEQPKQEQAAPKSDKDQLPPPEPDFPDIVVLEPFVKIKLQESEALNYITLKIAIELIKPEMRKSFEANKEKIRKSVEDEVKKMTWLVLRSPEGKLNFKYSLIKELNGALPSRMIQNVYFTSFILQ